MAMKLMRDTGSLMNYLMVNDNFNVKVGDTFAELMWTDRKLFKVVRLDGKKIIAKVVRTELKNGWEDGTEYPITDDKGEWVLDDTEHIVTKPRKYWKLDGRNVHLSWGATTGYRDPSF